MAAYGPSRQGLKSFDGLNTHLRTSWYKCLRSADDISSNVYSPKIRCYLSQAIRPASFDLVGAVDPRTWIVRIYRHRRRGALVCASSHSGSIKERQYDVPGRASISCGRTLPFNLRFLHPLHGTRTSTPIRDTDNLFSGILTIRCSPNLMPACPTDMYETKLFSSSCCCFSGSGSVSAGQ